MPVTPLPNTGEFVSALPAATSTGAIDLLGVQAGVTKKVPNGTYERKFVFDVWNDYGTTITAINLAIDAAVAAGGGIVDLGAHNYSGTTAVNLLSLVAAPRNGVTLRGAGRYRTTITRTTAGPVVELAGYFNQVRDLGLDGSAKTAITGLMVRAYSAATPTYHATRRCQVANVYIANCKEGVRLGHYSTLNGVAGDLGDADLTGNEFDGIWVDNCDYGWIEDGQNILENKVNGLITTTITFHHVYQPRGGYFNVDTWDAGGTTTTGYAKIRTLSGNVIVRRCRSENGVGAPLQVPFIETSNALTHVLIEQSEITNLTGPTNVDLKLGGGVAVLINNTIDGSVELSNTQYVGIGNTVAGGYVRVGNQHTQRESIFDSALTQVSELVVQSNNNAGIITKRDAVGTESVIRALRGQDRGTAITWGQLAWRVTDATSGAEKAVLELTTRRNAGNPAGGLCFGDSAPVAGTWYAGDIVFSNGPAAGGFIGWVCVTGGAPGTWKTFGAISA